MAEDRQFWTGDISNPRILIDEQRLVADDEYGVVVRRREAALWSRSTRIGRTPMAILLPAALQSRDSKEAVVLLRRYYGEPYLDGCFTGAHFDGWDSTADRAASADVFTADDLVAVTFLSVNVPAAAARQLLVENREEFSDLLHRVGPDRDLVEESEPLDRTWPAWELERALMGFRDVGLTIATKLIARKRPRLYPIYDSVVGDVLGTTKAKAHLEPIRLALRAQDHALHRRLLELRAEAGLPEEVTSLRVLDVIAWMSGRFRRDEE